jgi:hypothetical protein
VSIRLAQVQLEGLAVRQRHRDSRSQITEAIALQIDPALALDDMLTIAAQGHAAVQVQGTRRCQRVEEFELCAVAAEEDQLDLDLPRNQTNHTARPQRRAASRPQARIKAQLRASVDIPRARQLQDPQATDPRIRRALHRRPNKGREVKLQMPDLQGLLRELDLEAHLFSRGQVPPVDLQSQ